MRWAAPVTRATRPVQVFSSIPDRIPLRSVSLGWGWTYFDPARTPGLTRFAYRGEYERMSPSEDPVRLRADQRLAVESGEESDPYPKLVAALQVPF